MDMERNKRWINVSLSLGKIEAFFVPTIQGLGRLDSELIVEDDRFCELSLEEVSTIDESLRLTDRFTYSYLWVLGLYELVRTLDDRCRNNFKFLGSDLNDKVKELKNKIGRLRVPLAKMEPSKKYEKIDSPIAYPAIHRTFGISWHISNMVYISRRELSDDTLSLFEEIYRRFEIGGCPKRD